MKLLEDDSKKIVIQKGSQMGVSTYCILLTLYLTKLKIAPRGVIYWLPTRSLVNDFVSTKLDPLIEENTDDPIVNQNSSDKDNLGIKMLYGIPTFWRGLESKSGVKSISADAAIYDELDESDQSQVRQARERLSGSDIKIERELSTPTIPDFGINKVFQESDQHHFFFKCESCSQWNSLELDFPRNFLQDLSGNWYRGCKKCKQSIENTKGFWAPITKSDLRGYCISQLYSKTKTANEIMNDYYTTEFIGHFYNHVVGQPYLSATDRVTESQVLNLCNQLKPMKHESIATTFMGIDQGSKLHCVIMQKPNIVLWVGELDQFEQVDEYIKKFRVSQVVIDALPETRKARELMNRHKNKVWLCFYNDNQKGSYAWNEDERIVSVNRTESLDVGTQSIISSTITLPARNQWIEMFAKHCSNIAKTSEENKETGAKKYTYKKLGPDHLRHALNYCQIAMSGSSGGVVSVTR
ncbi:MAG: phage terminase large subunit family protein [Chitinophagaceae bacterium]|nr:phage terminase large subunit family protein [Chitinophagaceae bacterium]